MGLQCSLLGHAFEDAGVEREREEQGSEVVTTEREIERCRRCGTERVVSESTEVAAVVDASDVGLDNSGTDAGATAVEGGAPSGESGDGGGIASAAGRSDTDATDRSDTDAADADGTGFDATPPGSGSGEFGTDGPTESATALDPDAGAGSDAPPDPAEEDAEILTDDGGEADPADREIGEWPGGGGDTGVDGAADTEVESTDGDDSPLAPEEESLSGITVPEGEIACPECAFRIGADSGYRAGDPCPDCGAWLQTDRDD